MTETILELFKRRVNEFGPRAALLHKQNGEWEEQSWKEWWEQTERLAAGLIDLGVEPGDRVCVLSDTRIEWVWIDMAVAMTGAAIVPIYPSTLPEQCAHIIRDSQAQVAFVQDPSQLDKLVQMREALSCLRQVVYLDHAAVLANPDWKGRRQVRLEEVIDADDDWIASFDALAAVGRRRVAEDHRYVADRRQGVDAEDLATIIYTSGTAGTPKGVEHTHASLAAEVDAIAQLGVLTPDDRQLLFLPLAHIFAKMLFLAAIGTGVQTAFAENLPSVVTNLREVRPTFFAGVPRIFEKIHAQLLSERDRMANPDSSLFERAMRRGKEFSRLRQQGRALGPLDRLEDKLYRTVIFDRIRELFGGNVRFLFCGGAPLRADLAEFFHAAGILILEGYGLTETAAVSTLNLPDDFRFGSVGKPLPGVDLTIAEDGEVLVRGPMVMRRYHGLEDQTAAAVDAEEGWFHTGDLGRFDRDGFLYITGRKKHLIVTSGGKNVAPEQLETRLNECQFIHQAVICGDERPFISAMVTLDETAETWAIQHGISFETRAELADHPQIREQVAREIAKLNEALPHFETVRRFHILPEPLTAEAGELTPTGKVRRRAVLQKYRDVVDTLYKPAQAPPQKI
jgi:long-chain acyl-CoA synthetase